MVRQDDYGERQTLMSACVYATGRRGLVVRPTLLRGCGYAYASLPHLPLVFSCKRIGQIA
jgi:hypothetical protein